MIRSFFYHVSAVDDGFLGRIGSASSDEYGERQRVVHTTAVYPTRAEAVRAVESWADEDGVIVVPVE